MLDKPRFLAGTDVALYGQFSKTPTATALPITCNIDGSPGNMDNFTAYLPGATVRLCFRDGLGLSSHQLVANFTSDSDAIYWVDNLNYMSAPNANLTGKTSRLVATSSAIRYSSASNWDDAWIKGSMFSNSAGASLEADFYGTLLRLCTLTVSLLNRSSQVPQSQWKDTHTISFPASQQMQPIK